MILMDVATITNILGDFSNLGIEELEEELAVASQRIADMHHHLECKAKVSEVLEEELNDLEHHVEKLSTESENLDVQIIRASTQHKKFLKNIDKLKSLDVSHAKIEVSGNDKMKLAKKKTILHLMKKLSSTFLNKEDEGFVLNPRDLQIKQFHLNKNNSKQKNRDILWKHIGNSSRYNEEWNQLF